MLEMKQIQYFVMCVKTGSFSKAAEALYTTQPSVSRVIKSMEDEIGVILFERYPKGIALTEAGEKVYRHAAAVLENLQKIEAAPAEEVVHTLRISTNPSSWFADTFLEYYQQHSKEKLHYQIHSAETGEIVRRVQERRDDLGFVYVMKNQLPGFHSFLSGNYLEFEELHRSDIVIYTGTEHPVRKEKDYELRIDRLRLVQRFADEFSSDNYWDVADGKGHYAADAEVVVVTNSDYIMQRLLQMSDLANISGTYLTGKREGVLEGIPVDAANEEKIVFGCLRRRGEALPEYAEIFLQYVREKLQKKS